MQRATTTPRNLKINFYDEVKEAVSQRLAQHFY